MILLPAAQVAASIIAITLASGCARNMIQTAHVTKLPAKSSLDFPKDVDTSTEAMLNHLQSLSRSELLHVFCNSPAPVDLDELSGEWCGILLNNNNLGMTSIGSKFVSNALFGKGREWNGKSFESCGRGINRFRDRNHDVVAKEHQFDFSLQESKIKKGSSSVCLDYSKYQFPLSLWRTMKDEIRCLPCGVLIGFGSMTWSGGVMNSAPFCLYPTKNSTAMN